MIVYHQSNIGGFAGALIRYDFNFGQFVASPSAPAEDVIAQARATSRFVFSRVHGRVN